MKKIVLAALSLILGSSFCFAGDAAVFVDIGFSADSKTYIFGQYGKTDGDFDAWAEIYTVDILENDYVPGEVYKATFPGNSESGISGKKAFETLLEKSEWKIAKYDVSPTDIDNLIYVCENESKDPLEEIVFRDYSHWTSDNKSIFYSVKLVPTYIGSGTSVKSCFYINLVRKDQDGKVLFEGKVGTPKFMRDGISGYRITRIFTDDTCMRLIFVIEKTLEDETGTSIRYMVEAVSLI